MQAVFQVAHLVMPRFHGHERLFDDVARHGREILVRQRIFELVLDMILAALDLIDDGGVAAGNAVAQVGEHAVHRSQRRALVFGLAAAVLAWVGVSTFLESLSRDAHSITPLAVPLAIPQGLWAAGLVFLCLTSLYLFVKALVRLVRGDRMGVVALIGTRTAEDDLREQQQVIEDIAAKGNGHA